MTPKEFLDEEFANVQRALHETLRYDYGPDSTRTYYEECSNRLREIEKQIPRTTSSQIWARLSELSSLAGWISLIERSRLGEFSWPFAELVRTIANPLLAETHIKGHAIQPIIHVVAEGEGYQIVYENAPPPSSGNRFAIVAFPRPLKHHVLLHTIFGHELGHAAQDTNAAGALVASSVRQELSTAGQLSCSADMTSWIHDRSAPSEVKNELSDYLSDYGKQYEFEQHYIEKWLDELVCDLFGLLLFGPGFAAAHRALLRPTHRTPYEVEVFDPTHPPYAVRQKMLVRAMRLLKWDQTITRPRDGKIHEAEKSALKYLLEDRYIPWASFFDDNQLKRAITGLQSVLLQYGSLEYRKPNRKTLVTLVKRLSKRLPPILAGIGSDGKVRRDRTDMAQSLYAGWVYWLGAH